MALEAAVLLRIAEIVKNGPVKAREKAARMAAKTIAFKAFKESQARQFTLEQSARTAAGVANFALTGSNRAVDVGAAAGLRCRP